MLEISLLSLSSLRIFGSLLVGFVLAWLVCFEVFWGFLFLGFFLVFWFVFVLVWLVLNLFIIYLFSPCILVQWFLNTYIFTCLTLS